MLGDLGQLDLETRLRDEADRLVGTEMAPTHRVRVYGPATFCWVVAAKLGLKLLGPPDDLLLALPSGELGRAVDGVTLEAAVRGVFPRFVKPVVPKQFMAAVYESGDNLAAATVGLDPDVLVMVSDVVSFDAEARLFIDSRSQVVAHAVFEGDAQSARAVERGSQIAERLSLDVPYVMDLGRLDGQWVVVEFNEAWGSGLNGCAASGAALAILEAVTTD